jgi:tRNAThr (cytosine32-N3)-methyltransferase
MKSRLRENGRYPIGDRVSPQFSPHRFPENSRISFSLSLKHIMAPDRGVEEAISGLNLSRTTTTQYLTSENIASSTSEEPLPPHLSHDPATNAKRSDPFQFGQRFLLEEDDVFSYNAWDHVVPDEEHYQYCEAQYAAQRAKPVSDFDRERFNAHPEKWWDLFYKQKTSTFFKDRKWLVQEFPILTEVTAPDAGKKLVLEVGAGAGNTAFPILRMNENPDLKLFAVDFSKNAVDTMRGAEDYKNAEGAMEAEVWDVAGDVLPPGLEDGTVDVIIMIFIFSALNPKQWDQALSNIRRLLKPGGEVLFRDYGRGDLAQVRFKAGRWMEDNFYVRGDGTRVYFFEKAELEKMWRPSFEIVNLDIDRRLIVNRQRRLKMYRCWIQGRFRKEE